MPHREAAWALLAERLDEAAGLCGSCRRPRPGRGPRLDPVLDALRDMSATLAAELPAGSAHARLAAAPDALDAGRSASCVTGPASWPAGRGPGELAGLFGAVYAIVLAAGRYPAGSRR